jgi:hypothetical protein
MEIAQTFGAQSTFVLPAPGRPGRFIFMADQWNPDDLSSSRCGLSNSCHLRRMHSLIPLMGLSWRPAAKHVLLSMILFSCCAVTPL